MSWLSKSFKKVTGVKLSTVTGAAVGAALSGVPGAAVLGIAPQVWGSMSPAQQRVAVADQAAELQRQQVAQQQVGTQLALQAAQARPPADGLSNTMLLVIGGVVAAALLAVVVLTRKK